MYSSAHPSVVCIQAIMSHFNAFICICLLSGPSIHSHPVIFRRRLSIFGFHIPFLNKSRHLSTWPHYLILRHIIIDAAWCVIISLSYSLAISDPIDLFLCFSFDKWTLQTSLSSHGHPITHLSSTLYCPHFLLHCSLAP